MWCDCRIIIGTLTSRNSIYARVSMCPYLSLCLRLIPSGVFCLSRSYCFLKSCACDDMISNLLVNKHVCVLAGPQLWLRDSQSASRAPAPSCLAGQTPPFSGGWHRGGRRWAGFRRPLTCRRSGPTWGRGHRNDSASQVSQSWQDYTMQVKMCLLQLNHRPHLTFSLTF